MKAKTFGELAYGGYRLQSGGVSLVSGAPIPEWDGLTPKLQAAWEAAAKAVTDHCDNLINAAIEFVPDSQGGHLVLDGRVWRPEIKEG